MEKKREKRVGNSIFLIWFRIKLLEKRNLVILFEQIYPYIRFLLLISKLIKELQICLTT